MARATSGARSMAALADITTGRTLTGGRFVPIEDSQCQRSMCQLPDRRCPVLEVSFTIVCCRLCQASVL
jgi:hypothetical protein